MQVVTDLYQIEICKLLLSENFENNRRKWEEVNNESELASIHDGNYHMINTTKTRWNYYKTKTAIKPGQDFVIESCIELENNADTYGHFGLVWGFNEERRHLNRFTLSADGKRALVMHFEKDHHCVMHRFQNRNFGNIDMKKPIRFSIFKLDGYYYFFLNKKKVYMAHESFFCSEGNYAGYYLEPELSMKSNLFEVKKINVRSVWAITGMHQLMGD